MLRTGFIVFLLSLLIALPAYADINSDLLSATEKGDAAKVQELLNKGADVNTKGWRDRTALMLAAREGHTAIVKILLDNGADVNANDYRGSG